MNFSLKVLVCAAILSAQPPQSHLLDWGRYRGANINHQFTDADAQVLAGWGANVVRINFHQLNLMQKQPPYDIQLNAVEALDRILDVCERNGLKAILDPHTTPGTQSATSTLPTDPIWRDFAFHDHLVRLWRFLADRYKNRGPVIAGYDLLNEPSPPRGASLEGTPADWNLLVRKLASAIRAIDANHTLVVEFPIFANVPGGLPPVAEMVNYLKPIDDPNTVYSVHWYGPGEFTHQGVEGRPVNLRYPGFYRNTTWNAALHRQLLEPVAEFQHRYNVPIYLGEFAAARWAGEDGNRWMRDIADIAERFGWSWTYHSFRIASVWDAEKSNTDQQDETRFVSTPRIEMLREYYAANRLAAPRINGIANGASFVANVVSPLEIFALFGDQFGVPEPLTSRLDSNGRVAGSLGGVSVLFNSVAAPILYAGPGQIVGVVPQSVAGSAAVDVRLQAQSLSAPFRIQGRSASPGLFTVNSGGLGQVAALNQDGALNATTRPALRGSIVSLFLTGGGLLRESVADGSLVTNALPTKLPVQARIDGLLSEVVYAGAAPGLVLGVVQLNVRIPLDTSAGPHIPVLIEVDGVTSAVGTVLAIQ